MLTGTRAEGRIERRASLVWSDLPGEHHRRHHPLLDSVHHEGLVVLAPAGDAHVLVSHVGFPRGHRCR